MTSGRRALPPPHRLSSSVRRRQLSFSFHISGSIHSADSAAERLDAISARVGGNNSNEDKPVEPTRRLLADLAQALMAAGEHPPEAGGQASPGGGVHLDPLGHVHHRAGPGPQDLVALKPDGHDLIIVKGARYSRRKENTGVRRMVRVRWHSKRASAMLPPGRSRRARCRIIIESPKNIASRSRASLSSPDSPSPRWNLRRRNRSGVPPLRPRERGHSVAARRGRCCRTTPTTAAADAAATTKTTTTPTTTTDAAREGDRPVLLEWTTPPAQRRRRRRRSRSRDVEKLPLPSGAMDTAAIGDQRGDWSLAARDRDASQWSGCGGAQ